MSSRGKLRLGFVSLSTISLIAGLYVLVCNPFSSLPGNEHLNEQSTDDLDSLPIVRWADRHHFPEIRSPWYVSSDEKENTPAEGEPVIGFVLGDQARAYSTNQLNDHEMVIDEVAGVPILVTYCPLCRTGIVYDRRVHGEVLDFGHRGWIYQKSFLFYDDKTDSLWVQATGKAIHGAYKGQQLERLPSTQTTWGQWRRQHPKTLVLGQRPDEKINAALDKYEEYYRRGGSLEDKNAGPLHFGLAVLARSAAKLYPFSELAKKPFVVDWVGKVPVLIIFHEASGTAQAFERLRKGLEIRFDQPEVTKTDVLFKDRMGSTWSGLTGECLEGPLQGFHLKQLDTTKFVEENWKLHYPEAPVYKAR
jgi:hypothetical protein